LNWLSVKAGIDEHHLQSLNEIFEDSTMAIYQNYSLDDLEAQYNIEATVANIDVYRIEYTNLSEKITQEGNPTLEVPYASHPLQKLDIFPAQNDAAPIIIYIHGGYWLRGDKTPYRFPSKTFNRAGTTWIPINYRLASEVTLNDIVNDVRNAVAWVYNNAAEFNSDKNRICVVGSSAGAHLAGMVAASNWQNRYDVPENVIKGIAGCSGLYDLEPFRHTSQNNYLKLSALGVKRNSPARHMPRLDLAMLISWAGKETPEFQRQSHDYAAQCKAAGISVETLYLSGTQSFLPATRI
jgi:arylformamidase